eukprot:8567652-Pyramimonas_sp.AAC.1
MITAPPIRQHKETIIHRLGIYQKQSGWLPRRRATRALTHIAQASRPAPALTCKTKDGTHLP